MKASPSRNVLGGELIPCSLDPMTGYFRDGCCRVDDTDFGRHLVCAVMTEDFLTFTKRVGNDLSTPRPEYEFPGLKPGDQWCLCVSRWKEAADQQAAPKVVLEATHAAALRTVDLDELREHAIDSTVGRD